MIASYSNNFIFLKTRKTGGTSVEMVLSTWCSGDDVCSPIYAPDEIERGKMGGHSPTERIADKKIHAHLTAPQVKDLFPELWERAFKFTVERHPYEKIVSRVYWNIGRRGGDPVAEFDKELSKALDDESAFLDRHIYTIDGKLAVDRVFLHHNMWDELGVFAKQLGRSVPALLPQAKAGHRRDSRPAHEILSPEQKARVREAAAFEFKEFSFAE